MVNNMDSQKRGMQKRTPRSTTLISIFLLSCTSAGGGENDGAVSGENDGAVSAENDGAVSADAKAFDGAPPAPQRIAYEVSGHLWVADADGSNPMQLTTTGSPNTDPSWSPDGRQLVYMSRPDASTPFSIWLMNADGGNPREILAGDPTEIDHIGRPRWSPDGTRIVFHATVPGREFGLYTIAADGSDRQTLLDTNDSEQAPAWSPDGQTIVYHDLSTLEIRTIAANGGPPSTVVGPLAALFVATPVWSRDGNLILFSQGDFESTLKTVKPDGSALASLTAMPGTEAAPTVSRDGLTVAFYHYENDSTYGVYTISLMGGTAQLLIDRARAPAYSP